MKNYLNEIKKINKTNELIIFCEKNNLEISFCDESLEGKEVIRIEKDLNDDQAIIIIRNIYNNKTEEINLIN
jgi:hypothetical protein